MSAIVDELLRRNALDLFPGGETIEQRRAMLRRRYEEVRACLE